MAEKRIGRSIKTTICTCKIVNDDMSISDEEVKVSGKLSLDRAQNAVRKMLNNPKVLVESVKYEEFYCSMSIDEFIAHGAITY